MSGIAYDWRSSCVISAGGLSGILNALLATIGPGDEVITTDPIYAGLLNRIRLAGAAPRLVPLIPDPTVGAWISMPSAPRRPRPGCARSC
jgi:Aspartate/tyrosine/aromatic aminotransferase